MGKGVELERTLDRVNNRNWILKPRMWDPQQQLAKALDDVSEGSHIVEAFEDVAKQQAAQEKSQLTVIGRLRLRTTRAKIARELAEANETMLARASGENSQAYLAARNSAIEVFNAYSRAYMGDLFEKQKMIFGSHFHIAKAAEKFLSEIREIAATKQSRE